MPRLKVTSNEDVEHARKLIGELDLSKAWEINVKEYDHQRSIQQNRKYWKLVGELGSYLGYSTEEIHQMMKYKYLSYKQELLGDEVVVVPSTSNLSIKEFIDYLSNVEGFAHTLGFKLEEDY